jgi:EthD domain
VLKMIITCRRNPSLSRAQFFHHLRHVHWPLIQNQPDVLGALPGYVQNHSVLPEPGIELSAPFRLATDRDSVIELAFDGRAGIDRLLSVPAYMRHIRPDEARFNDLPHNIMVLANAATLFRTPTIGRCKRFDFICRSSAIDAATFRAKLNDHSAALALDPCYSAHVDRHVDNVVAAAEMNAGFGEGVFDAVREVWATSFAALSLMASRSAAAYADAEKSFSVFATEFPMHGSVD